MPLLDTDVKGRVSGFNKNKPAKSKQPQPTTNNHTKDNEVPDQSK